MKKLLALLLVFTMLFALVACSGGSNNNSTDNPADNSTPNNENSSNVDENNNENNDNNTPEAVVRAWFDAMYKNFDADAACSYTIQYNKDMSKYLNADADVDEWESKIETAEEQFESKISSIKEIMGENGSFEIDEIEQIDVVQTQGNYSSVIKKAGLDDFYENIDAVAEIHVTATLTTDSYTDTDEDTAYVALIDGKWYFSFH